MAHNLVLGDDCASNKVCQRVQSVSDRHVKARDQTLKKVFPKVLSTKLFHKVQESKQLQ